MIRVFEATPGFYVCSPICVVYVTKDGSIYKEDKSVYNGEQGDINHVSRNWKNDELTFQDFLKKDFDHGRILSYFHPRDILAEVLQT